MKCARRVFQGYNAKGTVCRSLTRIDEGQKDYKCSVCGEHIPAFTPYFSQSLRKSGKKYGWYWESKPLCTICGGVLYEESLDRYPRSAKFVGNKEIPHVNELQGQIRA